MSRNDGYLNTGMSSAIQRRQEARLEVQRQKRADARRELRPAIKQMSELIDAELKEVMNIEYMVMHLTTEKDIKSQLLARQLHVIFLKQLKTKLKRIVEAEAADEAKENTQLPNSWQQEAAT